MLLQGFACDQSQTAPPPFASFAPLAPLTTRLPPASAAATAAAALALASPPASPPQMSPPNTLDNLFHSCHSLQALLAAPAPAPMPSTPLPISPPQQHNELQRPATPSPIKLRLRMRKETGDCDTANNTDTVARRRIVKRALLPPRGLNKRRRAADDDMGREDAEGAEAEDGGSDADAEDAEDAEDAQPQPLALSLLAPSPLRRQPSFASASPRAATRTRAATTSAIPFALAAATTTAATTTAAARPSTPPRPQTPKRARIAPESLPLGLERGDFHALHADGVPDDSSSAGGVDVEREADGSLWSTEDDRMLVELVLEKLKLSKEAWQDCARSLGKDRHSLGRRWKSLMLHGDIGLKPGARARRGTIHGTWR